MEVVIKLVVYNFFLVVGTAASSKDLLEAKAICVVLCGNCQGVGDLQEDVCVCTVSPKVDENCYNDAKKRAELHDIGWKIIYSDYRRRRHPLIRRALHPDNRATTKILRRIPRNAPKLTYNPSYGTSGWETQKKGSAMYQIMLGSNEDGVQQGVQLVFPYSQGLEIQHQYIYRASDGKEYPLSSRIREDDILPMRTNPSGSSYERSEEGRRWKSFEESEESRRWKSVEKSTEEDKWSLEQREPQWSQESTSIERDFKRREHYDDFRSEEHSMERSLASDEEDNRYQRGYNYVTASVA